MADAPLTENDITYELFDIDPVEFYRRRFCAPEPVDASRESLALKSTISYGKTHRLLEAIRRTVPAGPCKILEVGCGSGALGARVKYNFPHCTLYGVDLSPDCIELARRNGFDQALACDVFAGLPYADETFDFVFTMDFWGHIEFVRKDPILAEVRRVTKKGGTGWHGIEAGVGHYLTCNPKDPNDPVRKYVHLEGHIGVETIDANVSRFSRFFDILRAVPWPIKPFLNIDAILASNAWGEQFTEAFLQFDSYNSRIGADVVLGYCNDYFLDALIGLFGPILTEDALRKRNLGPDLARFARAFVQGVGFAMLTVRRPR